MKKILIFFFGFFLLGGSLMFSGCQVSKPVQMPSLLPVPDSFPAKSNTNGIAALPVKQFFGDPFLLALIDSAIAHNPDLAIALEQIEIARAQVAIRRGAMLPSLNGVVTGSGDRYGDYTMNGVGNFDTNLSGNIKEEQKINRSFTPDFFVGFRSNWEIDIWGKLKNQRKAAAAVLLATEKGRQYAITNIVATVASLYYELMAVKYELDVIKKNIQLQQQALEVVKVQKEGGRATELAVKQFSAQLLNTRAIEFQTRQRKVELENQINAISGRFPSAITTDSTIIRQPVPEVASIGLPSSLLLRRPDIRQAEYELEAAQANVLSARAAFLPSLTLSPYVGYNAFRGSLLFNPGSIAYGILGGITAPIFNGNRIRSEYAIANAENKQAIYNYQKVILNSYSEVVTQLSRIENNEKMFALKDQEFNELNSAVSTARDLYLSGYANYLEIITAQKGVLDAELELAVTKKEIFLATVDLYRSLGGGWETSGK
jgi:multidrug efflux system outer membrane protein